MDAASLLWVRFVLCLQAAIAISRIQIWRIEHAATSVPTVQGCKTTLDALDVHPARAPPIRMPDFQ